MVEIHSTAPGLARDYPAISLGGGRDAESPARPDPRLRRVASEILRSVQSRLPGRVMDLKVHIDGDQFVISGVSTSYYVKQVAQHVAMAALDSVMLGRLVNRIEVRAR